MTDGDNILEKLFKNAEEKDTRLFKENIKVNENRHPGELTRDPTNRRLAKGKKLNGSRTLIKYNRRNLYLESVDEKDLSPRESSG